MARGYEKGDTLEVIISSIRLGSLWFWWGIGLAIHGFKTFGYDIFFGKNWEEKKVQELMDKE